MTHVWRPRYLQANPDLMRCRSGVHDGGRSVTFHQCNRKATVYRKLNGSEYGFCNQHDPEAVRARRDRQEEGWRIAAEARDKRYKAIEERQAAVVACVEAVRQIAAGHNDARALAVAAISRLDACDSDGTRSAETALSGSGP